MARHTCLHMFLHPIVRVFGCLPWLSVIYSWVFRYQDAERSRCPGTPPGSASYLRQDWPASGVFHLAQIKRFGHSPGPQGKDLHSGSISWNMIFKIMSMNQHGHLSCISGRDWGWKLELNGNMQGWSINIWIHSSNWYMSPLVTSGSTQKKGGVIHHSVLRFDYYSDGQSQSQGAQIFWCGPACCGWKPPTNIPLPISLIELGHLGAV